MAEKDKYYSEDEPEFLCPVCRNPVDITAEKISCENCKKIKKKAIYPDIRINKFLVRRLSSTVSHIVGRKISGNELNEIIDLITYHLR